MPLLDADQAIQFAISFEDNPPITLTLDLVPLVLSLIHI